MWQGHSRPFVPMTPVSWMHAFRERSLGADLLCLIYPVQYTACCSQCIPGRARIQGDVGIPEYQTSSDHEMDEYDEEYEEDGESGEDEEVEEEAEDDPRWAEDPKILRKLEELRWWFRSELEDPSAWTLQRIKSLIQVDRPFAAREVVRNWQRLVAYRTGTPEGAELRLPSIIQPELPFHRTLTWEEVEGKNFNPEWEVEDRYKRDARLAIVFLFPEAPTKGLSAQEKTKLIAIAANIWMVHSLRAEGLFWVLRNDYPHTRKEVGQMRKWANQMSEDFMVYTLLYPPPIITPLPY